MVFEPGNLVTLKSGGLTMTVSAVHDDIVECVWIGEEGESLRQFIPAVALMQSADRDDHTEVEEDFDGDVPSRILGDIY
jgi:uncharacterized protein YodC (DUF2158 family)